SVQIAGVLRVFSYLIVPAAISVLVARSVSARLVIGWALGFTVSIFGLVASAAWDLPTGATVVTTFGVFMAAVAASLGLKKLIHATRARGLIALNGVGITSFAAMSLAGLLLLVFPQIDHHWLNWLETAVPSIELAFLTSDERETYQDSQEAVQRGLGEIQQLRAMQQEIQWGTRELSEEKVERLRQYLASRSEITAGDQMVLNHLRNQARKRNRAIPSQLGGCGIVVWTGFVAKGVRGIIPVGLEVNLALSELGFERPSVFGIERSISLGKVELERDRNLRDVRGLFRRESVPRRCRVDIFDENGRQYGQGAAHAEADHPDFGAGLFQVLRRAANVLTCRLAEIEVSHQVLRLCSNDSPLALIVVMMQHS